MNRKTKYGWMALGGLLCLLGVVLACKVRDGNRAAAQSEATGPKLDGPEPPRAEDSKKDDKLVPVSDSARSLPAIAGEPLPELKPTPTPTPGSKAGPPCGPLSLTGVPPLPPPAPGTEQQPILIPASATVPAMPETTKGPPMPVASGPPASPMPAVTVPPSPPAGIEVMKNEVPSPSMMPVVVPAPAPKEAPTQTYRARMAGETLKTIARLTLGSSERCADLEKLNPALKSDAALTVGTAVRLPMEATLPVELGALKPLPMVRTKMPAPAPKVLMPLTGTFQVGMDEGKGLVLPKALRDQLGNCETVMLSPGTDKCLWLTNSDHLDRLGQRLDQSSAREVDVRNFKRLYYAQAVKTTVKADGTVGVAERLAAFAGLNREVVLVGFDDHFELWDAARYRRFTQQKARASAERE